MKLLCYDKRYSRTIRIYTMIFAMFWAFLLGSYNSTIMGQQADVPKIIVKEGQDTLLLPDKLLESIKTNFPGFRVPAAADMSAPWTFVKKPGQFPFITWGDYNGDGLTDVAIILISDKEYKFVIFNKKEQDYTPAYKIGGEIHKEGADIQTPQEISLKTLPAGVEKTVEFIKLKSSYEHTTALKYKFKFDAIEFHLFEKGMSLMYWENDKYNSIDIGSL